MATVSPPSTSGAAFDQRRRGHPHDQGLAGTSPRRELAGPSLPSHERGEDLHRHSLIGRGDAELERGPADGLFRRPAVDRRRGGIAVEDLAGRALDQDGHRQRVEQLAGEAVEMQPDRRVVLGVQRIPQDPALSVIAARRSLSSGRRTGKPTTPQPKTRG